MSRRPRLAAAWAMLLLVAAAARVPAEEPPLPEGLGQTPKPASGEPALPEGLEGSGNPEPGEPALPEGLEGKSEEPALPEGLGEKPKPPAEEPKKAAPLELPFDLTGFWEIRGGFRTDRDTYQKSASLGETRLQLRADKAIKDMTLRLTTDLLYDPVLNQPRVDLEEGQGVLDLREAYASLRPASFMDVKVGRQILTWGTADLVFLNDLFPKDWNAFFIGRDQEYLKAPSDALKVSLFSDLANLNVVYTPRFDPDRFIDGHRISYFNPMLGRRAGRDAIVHTDLPDGWFEDDEYAWRLYRNVGAYELAVYGYHGFWKSPVGFSPLTGRATFPPLSAYGASVRGPVARGIGNVEAALYDSRSDRGGNDPFVPNSQVRILAGYEQEVVRNFTAGGQYYVETLLKHEAYRKTLPRGMRAADRDRHVVTLRLTQLLLSQNLELSLFSYYCPTDDDAYLRPHAKYKVDDHWSVELGGNVFFGRYDHTFFGQFDDNTNVYVALRYGF